jgi:hypothetical protein
MQQGEKHTSPNSASPGITNNDYRSSGFLTGRISQVDKDERLSGVRGELSVTTRDSAPKATPVGEGKLTEFSGRFQNTRLTIRLAELES